MISGKLFCCATQTHHTKHPYENSCTSIWKWHAILPHFLPLFVHAIRLSRVAEPIMQNEGQSHVGMHQCNISHQPSVTVHQSSSVINYEQAQAQPLHQCLLTFQPQGHIDEEQREVFSTYWTVDMHAINSIPGIADWWRQPNCYSRPHHSALKPVHVSSNYRFEANSN